MQVIPSANFVTPKRPTADRFLRGKPAAAALLLLMLTAPARAAPPLDEHAAVRQICTGGTAAKIARAEKLRGSAAVTAASVLPNPSLIGEHQRSLSGATESETVVGVSVPVGLGGRRVLLEDAANERRRQAHAEAEVTRLQHAFAFREAYARAAAEEQRVILLAARQSALTELTATIRALTKAGEAAGYDLLRQQAQARAHESALEAVKARALALRSGLQAWTEAPIALPSDASASFESNPNAWRRLASPGSSARKQVLAAQARASAIEARAASRRWVPEFEVFAGYRQLSSGTATGHGIALGLTVPLTFFDHGQGEAALANAEREFALAAGNQLEREQSSELKAVQSLLSGLGLALAKARSASEEAREVESKARTLYAAGEANITELLEAYRAVEEVELAKLALEEEVALARVRAMRAAGSMFDPALDRACREAKGETP